MSTSTLHLGIFYVP